MDAVRNPYSPGAGRKPAALAARDKRLSEWRVALERIEKDRGSQPVIFFGLRGAGKTVLLSSFRESAKKRGWLTAHVEAGAGKSLREALGESLHGPLVDIARPSAGRRLIKGLKTALSLKASYDASGTWSFGIDLSESTGGGADTGTLETDLRKLIDDLAAAADEENVGLAILIDEAQDLSPADLVAVCAVAHAAAQENWHVLFALAGLPSLPRVLAEAKSYAERFSYHRIEALDLESAAAALIQPASDEDVSWDHNAVEEIIQASSGYPYFLQQFGLDTWNAATGTEITEADARVGAAEGRANLGNGFFRVRWDRATRAEQAYLLAMASDGDTGSQSGTVADRLGGRKSNSLAPARSKLIAKGLIYAPEHGIVAFTVPGMADFIRRIPQA
jgi:hypothetical protein